MQQKTLVVAMAVSIGCLCGALHIESAKNNVDPWYVQYKQVDTVQVTAQQKQVDVKELKLIQEYDEEIPQNIQIAAEIYGDKYNISPELIEAIAWDESRYIADAVSANGQCIGLMQVNPKWHKDRMKELGVQDLTNVYGNIKVGSDYLSELFEQYEEPEIVLMVYNGDSSWKNGHVSAYAKRVLKMAHELEIKHKKIP